MVLYVFRFKEAATSAAEPTVMAKDFTCEGVSVSEHVASHTKDCPQVHGTSVIPSGLLPSSRLSPLGSRAVGTPAEANARFIMSFSVECRENRPALLGQLKP